MPRLEGAFPMVSLVGLYINAANAQLGRQRSCRSGNTLSMCLCIRAFNSSRVWKNLKLDKIKFQVLLGNLFKFKISFLNLKIVSDFASAWVFS